ncbi:hypothetical protein [Chryseobacterium sp. Mn2064]|uniref:hypothetical protein n=1 Tax=Chryseobacterium sp. Mn2064 TaxID=3395263 RepID=UPI003BDC1377
MALPKKTSRTITAHQIEYTWMASGNDDIIYLIIALKKNSGQKLIALFDYVTIVEGKKTEIQITPIIVRKIIEYGIMKGWKADQKGKDVKLGVMNDQLL